MSNPKLIITIVLMMVFSGLTTGIFTSVLAADEENGVAHGIAIKGYDPVAYFTLGKAVKGNASISYTWNEAVWHFSDAKHRKLFAANPKKYAPQHSGY